MTLAIKCIHNLPPHLSYVSTRLPDITQKRKTYVVFLSIVWVAMKRTGFGVWWRGSEPVVWLGHSSCLKWRPFAFTHARSRVCHWLRRWYFEEYDPKCQRGCLLQLVNTVFQYLCNVRWCGKLCMHSIAKVVRISHANFHCNRLTTVQDIQDYASIIFWDTVYISNFTW